MSLAKSLLERHTAIKSRKQVREGIEDVIPSADPKIVESVKWLKESKWSENNDMQDQASMQMKALSESDDAEANKFMAHMDEAASKYVSEALAPDEPVDPAGSPKPTDENPVESEEEDDSDDEDEVSEEEEEEPADDEEEVEEEEEDPSDDDEEEEVSEDDSEDEEEDEEEEDDTMEKFGKKKK